MVSPPVDSFHTSPQECKPAGDANVRVTILLPVRNGAAHLGAALASVAKQTQPAHQVVVVNDASTDATPDLIQAWSTRLPITRVNGQGEGLVHALNAGLAACTGSWVARMDADDVMHPRRLELQVQHLLAHPEQSLCGTEVRSFPCQKATPKRHAYDAWLSGLHTPQEHARDIYVEAPLAHPTVMMRLDTVRRLGGYRALGWPEDYDLWLRFHGAGERMGKPAGVLHFWREHPTRLSRTSPDYSLDAIRRCRLHHLCQHWGLQHKAVVMVGAGVEGKAAGRALLALGVRVLAHVDADPKKVGGRLMGEGGVRVHAAAELPALMRDNAKCVAVVAIGTAGAREGVRAGLAQMGLREGVDTVVVA